MENADDLFISVVIDLDLGAQLAQEYGRRAAERLDLDAVRWHVADDPERECLFATKMA